MMYQLTYRYGTSRGTNRNEMSVWRQSEPITTRHISNRGDWGGHIQVDSTWIFDMEKYRFEK